MLYELRGQLCFSDQLHLRWGFSVWSLEKYFLSVHDLFFEGNYYCALMLILLR